MKDHENPSYDLAVEYVVEQIHDQLDDCWDDVVSGSLVPIGSMEDCDCIPLSVTDCRGRGWTLNEVRRRHVTHVYAEYTMDYS